MAIFKGRVRVRYGYSRWGYTRNNGKGWHGGSDEEGLDSTTILMPDYKGKSISGRVITARKVDKSTGSKTWEWGWYVCVELDLSLIHISWQHGRTHTRRCLLMQALQIYMG